MKLCITIFLLAVCCSARSQFQVGVRVGGNLTSFEKMQADAYEYDLGKGVYTGVIFNYTLNPELAFQSEFNFTAESGKRHNIHLINAELINRPDLNTGLPIYANVKGTTILHSLEIPLLAKFYLGKKVRYTMSFGPYINLLLNAKRKFAGQSIVYLDEAGIKVLNQNTSAPYPASLAFNYATTVNDKFKDVHMGVLAGCGLQVPLRSGNFFVDYRLKLGMRNIDQVPAMEGKHQLTAMSLSTGYLININCINAR